MTLREQAELDRKAKLEERAESHDESYAEQLQAERERKQPVLVFLAERLGEDVDEADVSLHDGTTIASPVAHWRLTIDSFDLVVEDRGFPNLGEDRFTLRVLLPGGYGRVVHRLADLLA